MNNESLPEQSTLPLKTAIERSAASFRAFLREHGLDPLTLSLHAGIRYLAIWNITQGNPVTLEQAARVRACLRRLTGIAYDGPICVYDPGKR